MLTIKANAGVFSNQAGSTGVPAARPGCRRDGAAKVCEVMTLRLFAGRGDGGRLRLWDVPQTGACPSALQQRCHVWEGLCPLPFLRALHAFGGWNRLLHKVSEKGTSQSAAVSALSYTMKPPSAVRTCPVRKEARSEAKKATAWAMSSGVPRRPRGVSSTSI